MRCSYLCITEGNQQQRQHVTEHERAHHVDFLLVQTRPLFPAEGEVVPGENVLVVHDGRCHGQGQYPNHHHPDQRVPRHPDGGGLSGVHDGNVPVHGHGRQREDAHQHGHGEEVVDELADERAQDPGRHHVDGGLEGDAEEQVGEVRDAQVEDEDVGGAPRFARLAARQHRDHHGVAQHAERKDEPEHQQRDEIIRPDAEQKFLIVLLLRHAEVPRLVHGSPGFEMNFQRRQVGPMEGVCAEAASWHALLRAGGPVRLHQQRPPAHVVFIFKRRKSVTPCSSHQFTHLLKLLGSLVVPPRVSECSSPGAHLTRLHIHRADPLSTLSLSASGLLPLVL